jgi:DNA-binding winged helix-turn-helix (wHTH) protein/TolB-like protein
MPPSAPTSKLVQFGVYELDLLAVELRKQGVRVKLQEQPLKILQFLLEKPGQIVKREQLRSRIWPADTYVEFDQGLYSAIARLRDALGDSSESPRFIETVPRQGYRFIAPVTIANPLPDTRSGEGRDQTPRGPGSMDYRRLITNVVAGLVGGGVLLTIVFAFDIAGAKEWLRSRTTPIRSIAVLPLENPSGNGEMDYLCQGISEEITNSLSRLPNLQVMALTTVTHYQSGPGDALSVGRVLHVDAVLTGRVVQHGSELDIETELVNVVTGTQLWGKRYIRNASDASSLLPAITVDLAFQLRPQFVGAEQKNLAKVETQNPEAYAFYLKGLYRYEKLTRDDLVVAAGLLEEAVGLDNHFAAAYVALAWVYATQGYFGSVPASAAYNKSRNAARRALELDSTLPAAHLALAEVDLDYFMDLSEAQVALERARNLRPNSALVHFETCGFNNELGKPQQAIAECRKALELEPLCLWFNIKLSITYYLAREYDKFLQQSNRTLEIGRGQMPSLFFIASAYAVTGKERGFVEEWTRIEREQGYEKYAEELRSLYEKKGYRAYQERLAKDFEKYGQFYTAATTYALLGQTNAALDNLERAVAEGQGHDTVKLDPALDTIRSDPRYSALLRRLGLFQSPS